MLCTWLTKLGYRNVRVVDVNQTSIAEQRSTEWMQFHSLAQFLDLDNSDLTIEGYPAPRRAILLANKGSGPNIAAGNSRRQGSDLPADCIRPEARLKRII